MRPRNQPVRDQFAAVLARHGASSVSELAALLRVSIPTVHRLLREQTAGRVLTGGRAGRTRYALRRALRGDDSDVPLYTVDADGNARTLAALAMVHPQGSRLVLRDTEWPIPEAARDGWWDGLPYPVYDMRPQGYLGRQLARAETQRLGVPDNPEQWSDEDIVFALAQCGADTSGNLILGDPACERWLQGKVAPPEPLRESRLAAAYAAYAERAVATGVPGSSAAGEFPKFAAVRECTGCATPHVLVKFSGADDSAAVRRWSDLLVCEHHALECAATMPGVESARSRIVQHGGRSFLEVERFDRAGPFGRTALCSLETLNAAFLGASSTDWTALAARMVAAGLLGTADAQRIERLWWYGRLIANSDMHLGNLSFRPRRTAFDLAPTYDMLPMGYAPLSGGEVPARAFDPALPLPAQRTAWLAAASAAAAFWQRAAGDARISAPFRDACAANGWQMLELAARA